MNRYEVRCPYCGALQFMARETWEFVAIDEATLAIKCWRRTCKCVLGLRVRGEGGGTQGRREGSP